MSSITSITYHPCSQLAQHIQNGQGSTVSDPFGDGEVDFLTSNEHLKRFYSDLTPIPHSAYQRTREEFEKLERKRHCEGFATTSEESLKKMGLVQVSGRPLQID